MPTDQEPRDRVIRLPKVTASRKRAYLEAARGQPLAEWMLDQCDRAVLAANPDSDLDEYRDAMAGHAHKPVHYDLSEVEERKRVGDLLQ